MTHNEEKNNKTENTMQKLNPSATRTRQKTKTKTHNQTNKNNRE